MNICELHLELGGCTAGGRKSQLDPQYGRHAALRAGDGREVQHHPVGHPHRRINPQRADATPQIAEGYRRNQSTHRSRSAPIFDFGNPFNYYSISVGETKSIISMHFISLVNWTSLLRPDELKIFVASQTPGSLQSKMQKLINSWYERNAFENSESRIWYPTYFSFSRPDNKVRIISNTRAWYTKLWKTLALNPIINNKW